MMTYKRERTYDEIHANIISCIVMKCCGINASSFIEYNFAHDERNY